MSDCKSNATSRTKITNCFSFIDEVNLKVVEVIVILKYEKYLILHQSVNPRLTKGMFS